MSERSRRNVLLNTAAIGGAAGVLQIDTGFLVSGALAQAAKPVVFLSAENITGDWDPTAHTTLSQKNVEGLGFLTRTPMRLDHPGKTTYEPATGMKLLDPHRLEIKLREGVTFHDGKPFRAEDVKAIRRGRLPQGARPAAVRTHSSS